METPEDAWRSAIITKAQTDSITANGANYVTLNVGYAGPRPLLLLVITDGVFNAIRHEWNLYCDRVEGGLENVHGPGWSTSIEETVEEAPAPWTVTRCEWWRVCTLGGQQIGAIRDGRVEWKADSGTGIESRSRASASAAVKNGRRKMATNG